MPFKTLLVLSPKYNIDFPPLGTPALLGFLRSRGKAASQWDLNHEYVTRLAWRLAATGGVELTLRDRIGFSQTLANDIYRKQKARSAVYYAGCLRNPFPTAAYDDYTASSYFFAENLLDSPHLERFLSDENENPFFQFYLEAGVVDRIRKLGVGLLGVSVIGPSQIVATLTLAKLLKERLSCCPKIVIGGQWPTLYFDQLLERPDFTRWLDFIIRGEGETPLLSLVETLEGTKALETVPNLAYVDAGKWKPTVRRAKEDMSRLPTPDFDGMPLGDYQSEVPGVTLTFETSRECYWNRCTYCVDLPMPHEGYRAKPVHLLVDDIAALKEKHDVQFLEVSDPAIAPKRLRDLSQALLDRGLKMPFWAFARLEKNFTKELFDLAHKAGMTGISFGMETASQRVMDMVDKGTKLEDCRRVIRDAAQARLRVTLQIILRLPTETFEEGLETVRFLVDNRQWIENVAFNVYYLTPGNLIFQNPERSRIRILPGQPKFRFFRLFENLEPGTMTYAQADELMALYRVLLEPLKKKELDGPGADSEKIFSALPIGSRVAACSLELCGARAERELLIAADGTPAGLLRRRPAAASL